MFELANMQDLLLQWGYLVILLWTFIEGETVVIVAGFLSNQGILEPHFIALSAFVGSFCSDQFMFFLGRHFGPAILKKFPRLDKNTDKVRQLMHKYENALILGFRFIYGVRNITPIMLGMSGVHHFKFFALNLLGAAVWAVSFTYGGYYVGEVFSSIMSHVTHGAAIGVGVLLLAFAVMWWIRRRRDQVAIENAQKVAEEGLKRQLGEPDPAAMPAETENTTPISKPNE